MKASVMELKRIFIILVDISGYTRFIKVHKISLLHAEKIIGELMESILARVEVPVMAHEILGDAISMYAVDQGIPGQGDLIYRNLNIYFDAFREREASLISACNICKCEACKQVGQLRLKAIVHAGEAAFTTVHNTLKISGEDIIIAHRLLKNSIPSDEYILMTQAFIDRCQHLDTSVLQRCKEHCEGIGDVDAMVRDFQGEFQPRKVSTREKLRDFFMLEGYMIARMFKPARYSYRNLPRNVSPDARST